MSAEDNKLHGPSVLRFVETEEWHRTALPHPASDEVVYVANEVFEDGLTRVLVCWRPTTKPNTPAKDVKTCLTPIVSYWESQS
jgi:hypothetical protein